MAFTWYERQVANPTLSFGPLALYAPILELMDVEGIIDRHLPQDPQAEFSNGSVLTLLVAARVSCPMALAHVPEWAAKSGADTVWQIPPEKLNDDRLGRALDRFYTKRHEILASIALHVSHEFDLSLERLHYDPTHLLFYGAHDHSQPRENNPLEDPPAHITRGHPERRYKIVHAGVCAAVDEHGAVPIFGHVTDGNSNGHTAVREQFELLQQHLPRERLLMISDRGTYSAGHLARLHRQNLYALCAANWKDFQPLYEQHRSQLHWHRASFLSIEQQRRRDTDSSLPRDHYDYAILKHRITDPETQEAIRCRLLFVLSTAKKRAEAEAREKSIDQIDDGLRKLTAAVTRGHHTLHEQSAITKRVNKLFGKKSAARYFHCEVVPLTDEERAACPPPATGCRVPKYRLCFSFNQAAADADAAYDGLTVYISTAPLTYNADDLFTFYKEQCLLEHTHHQMKTPLAVRPIFLKRENRVEALVHLLMIASTAYHLIQRVYRQNLSPDASVKEKRTTTETLLRNFAGYALQVRRSAIGRHIAATQLSSSQRQILNHLSFPTPNELLSRKLQTHPP